jgi:signal transduction histidine kinase
MIRSVLQRGIRADERTSGHGIGLAIVREIVHLYEGRLDIGKSALGGAKMTVTLPV